MLYKQLRKWPLIALFQTLESEKKFAKISAKMRHKSAIFYGVNLGPIGEGLSIHKCSKNQKIITGALINSSTIIDCLDDFRFGKHVFSAYFLSGDILIQHYSIISAA